MNCCEKGVKTFEISFVFLMVSVIVTLSSSNKSSRSKSLLIVYSSPLANISADKARVVLFVTAVTFAVVLSVSLKTIYPTLTVEKSAFASTRLLVEVLVAAPLYFIPSLMYSSSICINGRY